jgi:uncharacterized membrane protein (UPF0127 family)
VGVLRIDRLAGPAAPLCTGGVVLAGRCHLADRTLARLVGLLGTGDLAPDEALWISRCGSVHSFGLRARIGCAFLDASGRVLRVVDPLPRWRVAGARGATDVVEAPAGVLAGVRPGDTLSLGAPG